MNSSSAAIRRHLIEGIVLILGTGAVIALLNLLVGQTLLVSGIVLLGLFVVVWMFFSRDLWWIPVPTAFCFGGLINVGFKIYSYELGLLVAILAAIPIAATRRNEHRKRSFMPHALLALAVYLTVRMSVDLYLGNMDGFALGNIFRVYVMGLWPLAFAIPFVILGSTQCLKKVFWIMYVAALIRCLLGIVGYLFPRVLPSTDLSIVLPGIYTEGVELRSSGLWLIYMALAAWSLTGRRIHLVHSLVVIFAVSCVFLGGGRGSLGVMVALLVIWMCAERRFVMLGVFASAVVTFMVALNLNADLIYEFPERLQRTLSILMLRTPFHDIHRIIEGSDEWHRQLAVIAITRWTDSPWAFLFGHRLIPFSEGADPMMQSFYDLMKSAADLGYYEAGLWTVLAVTGAVGGILYGMTLWKLAKPLWGWVWRERVRTISTAFGFIALSSTALWLAFGWIIGHFPSEQIVLLLIARSAYEEQKSETIRVDPA